MQRQISSIYSKLDSLELVQNITHACVSVWSGSINLSFCLFSLFSKKKQVKEINCNYSWPFAQHILFSDRYHVRGYVRIEIVFKSKST